MSEIFILAEQSYTPLKSLAPVLGRDVWSKPFAVLNQCKAIAAGLNSKKTKPVVNVHTETFMDREGVYWCVQDTQLEIDGIVLTPMLGSRYSELLYSGSCK